MHFMSTMCIPNEDMHADEDMRYKQDGSKNGRRTLKIFWEDWYAPEISRFVCNKVQLF